MRVNIEKLSINVIATVVAMSFIGPAFAQSAATGPNKVYIEQLGNSNTVTIDQVGGTNNVGGISNVTPSSSNYATINGSSNQLALSQTGNNNLGQYHIRGNNNIYNSTTVGSNNKTYLNVGDSSNPNNLRNTINETITGDSNTVIQNIIGNDITSTLVVTGNSNEVTKELKSSRGTSDINILGNNNKLDIQQLDSAGAAGHYLKQEVVGDFNSIVTQQQGSNDTTVDIKTTGSHNTITVRSSNAAIVGPMTAVAR